MIAKESRVRPHENPYAAIYGDRLVRSSANRPSRRDGTKPPGAPSPSAICGVRLVEYSPGYTADHWCDLGHVLYVVEGELDTELRDGRTFKLRHGMSYQVSDRGDAAHRSSRETGIKLFIVD